MKRIEFLRLSALSTAAAALLRPLGLLSAKTPIAPHPPAPPTPLDLPLFDAGTGLAAPEFDTYNQATFEQMAADIARHRFAQSAPEPRDWH